MHTPARFFVCAAFIVAAVLIPTATRTGYTQTAVSGGGQLAAGVWNKPVAFEPNHGQAEPGVQFVTHRPGYSLSLSAGAAVLSLLSRPLELTEPEAAWRTTALRVEIAGGRAAHAIAEEPLPGVANYFIGNDPSKWIRGIPTFGRVRYQDVYPGVDLVYYGNSRGELEYDFVVAPGANPANVRLRIHGADALELSDAGELVARVPGGEVRMGRPLTYQDLSAGRRSISGEWTLFGADEAGFTVGPYDRNAPLVIDPTVVYTFSEPYAERTSVVVDAAGNAYVAGNAATAARTQVINVHKISPAGALLATTTFGGTVNDAAWGLAIDSSANLYVTGLTWSADFPTTAGAFDRLCGANGLCENGATWDGFVTKLPPDLSTLTYSTYLGGSSHDYGTAIAVDAAGNAYIGGRTLSTDFPISPGAFDSTFGGSREGFVAKLSATGSSLLFATYLGGGNNDSVRTIAVDSSGNVYAGGDTDSNNFPIQNAFQIGGSGFITKLTTSGSPVFSTYFGVVNGIAVDAASSVYVTGEGQYVAQPNGYQSTPAAGYVAKLQSSGSALAYFTYWNRPGASIAVNSAGNAHVVGSGDYYQSPQLPLRFPIFPSGNGWAVKFNPAGTNLVYSTPLPRNAVDVAVDGSGNAYVIDPENLRKIYDGTVDICPVILSPATANFGSDATPGTFAVAASSGTCNWTAVSSAPWITITAGASGTGNGTVSYTAAANTTGAARSSFVDVNGSFFNINQSATPCSVTIDPAGRTHGAGSEISTVAVTANCSWTATSNANWITITSGASGTGGASLVYTVAANPTIATRTGTLTIGGQTYTVTQAAGTCSFAITPGSRNHTATAEAGTVTVTAPTGCTWTSASNASWITITAGATGNGTGTGTVSYAVAENASMTSRTGTLTIAGQTFTITQAGAACSFGLSPTTRSHGAGAETGTVAVTTQAGCTWTAISNTPWITITAGASGSGNGSVTYSVTGNTAGITRSGTLTIAGQTFTVTQAGVACSFTLNLTNRAYGPGAETSTVNVTTPAGCSWIATSNASWITITAGASGTGSGSVSYSVAANTGTSSRTGTMTIGGQTFTVTQAAAGCGFSVAPLAVAVGAGGSNGAVTVTAQTGCAWNAASNAAWITVSSGSSGTGNGTVSYSVATNSGAARTGTLTVAGQTVTITQAAAAAPCMFTISPTSRTHSAAGGSAAIALSAPGDCAWTAASNAAWITLATTSGSGSGTVGYTVAVNTGPERTGTLTVAGQTFTVTQAAGTTSTCTFTITPTSRSHGADAATGTVTVTTQTGCSWTAAANASWLTVTAGATGSGSGSVAYSVAANASGERTGTLTIASQTFTVTQLATGTPAPAAVVDAGRFGRSVPPGGLASLFGTSFGTSTLVAQAIPLPTTLGGVSVLLNGVALPLFFVSPTQVNFQLPWDVPAGATLTVTVNGVTSAPMTVNTSERAPAIFSMDSTGRGQGAVIIAATGEIAAPVGSIPGRVSRPARRGEFVSIFASGLGPVTSPPPPGAAATSTQLSLALVAPSVTIGGAGSQASFTGLAPGFVGLYQVNAQVPFGSVSGPAVPLTLMFPDGPSNTVTIAVE